jgi:predicted nucleic acid-binding protein
MSFLLDTDTCSAHLKQKGNLTHKFLQHMGRLHISVITVGELYTWALRANASPQRSLALSDLLDDVQVIAIDEVIAHKFGEVRASLLDIGMSVQEMDLMIAATALVHNLTVVTHNVQDCANVPGLAIDDWLVR